MQSIKQADAFDEIPGALPITLANKVVYTQNLKKLTSYRQKQLHILKNILKIQELN